MLKSISPFHFWTYFLWEILKREKTFQHFLFFIKKLILKKILLGLSAKCFFAVYVGFMRVFAGFCGFFCYLCGFFASFLLVFCGGFVSFLLVFV